MTGLIRSAEGSSAFMNAISLPMIFLSGAFFPTTSMPSFLQAISDVLPLTYLVHMLRDAFLTGNTLAAQGTNIGALLAWATVALILALRTFSWEPREL